MYESNTHIFVVLSLWGIAFTFHISSASGKPGVSPLSRFPGRSPTAWAYKTTFLPINHSDLTLKQPFPVVRTSQKCIHFTACTHAHTHTYTQTTVLLTLGKTMKWMDFKEVFAKLYILVFFDLKCRKSWDNTCSALSALCLCQHVIASSHIRLLVSGRADATISSLSGAAE